MKSISLKLISTYRIKKYFTIQQKKTGSFSEEKLPVYCGYFYPLEVPRRSGRLNDQTFAPEELCREDTKIGSANRNGGRLFCIGPDDDRITNLAGCGAVHLRVFEHAVVYSARLLGDAVRIEPNLNTANGDRDQRGVELPHVWHSFC